VAEREILETQDCEEDTRTENIKPSIPARDPNKISGSKIAPVMGNPFTASANDAFGMSSFSSGTIQPTVKDPFAAGAFGAADFSLDQLDPLKK